MHVSLIWDEKTKQAGVVNIRQRILGLGYLLRGVVSHLRPVSLEALKSPLTVWLQLQTGSFLFKVSVQRKAFSLWQRVTWRCPPHLWSYIMFSHVMHEWEWKLHYIFSGWSAFVQYQSCPMSCRIIQNFNFWREYLNQISLAPYLQIDNIDNKKLMLFN